MKIQYIVQGDLGGLLYFGRQKTGKIGIQQAFNVTELPRLSQQ